MKMKMQKRKWALASGAALFALGAIAEVACSDNAATSASPSVPPSGSRDSGSSATSESGTDSATPPVTTTDGGAATCKTPKLHATAAGDVFCGYNDAGPFDCTVDSGTGQCCLGGSIGGKMFAPEQCQAFGSACTNPVGKGTPIECGQISDCTANGVTGAACCLEGAMGAPAPESGCSADDLKLSGGTAVKCQASAGGATDGGAPACASGLQICSQNLDCPAGMTCTPMHWKLYQLGFCK